jgi:hypothetical protein
MAGSARLHREAVKSKNLGINQPTAERTSVKLATAIKTPKTIDIARREDFSAGHDLFQSHPIFFYLAYRPQDLSWKSRN